MTCPTLLRQTAFPVLATFVLAMSVAGSASADCTDDGTTATCTGADTDGYVAPAGVSRVNVNANATVDTMVAGDAAIEVMDDTRVVTSVTSAITATGANTVGVRGGDQLRMRWNQADIRASGDRAIGVQAGDSSTLANVGRIGGFAPNLSTDSNPIGVQLGNDSTLCNGPLEQAVGSCFDPVPSEADGSVINGRGDDSFGVHMGDRAFVVNSGTIFADGASPTGLRVGDDSAIENLWFIQAIGDSATSIRTGDRADLRNSEQILAEGDASIGVWVGDDSFVRNLTGGLLDAAGGSATALSVGSAATITNRGTISARDADSVAVLFRSGGELLTNSGTLVGGTGSGTAVQFSDSPGGRVVNEAGGVIRGLGRFAIVGGATGDVVENYGRIDGEVSLGAGTDIYVTTSDSQITGLVDGGADSDRMLIRGSGNGVLDLGSIQGFEILDLGGSDRWTLRGATNLSGGTTLSSGTLDVDGLVSLGGAYTQQPGTVLRMRLDSRGQSDQLAVTGTATLNGGALELSSSGPVADGSRFILIDADAISGNFSRTPTGTAVLDLRLFRSGGDLGVRVSRQSYAANARSSNQRDLARYLDRLVPGARGDLADVLGTLDFLGADDFSHALDAMNVEYYDGQTHTSLQMGRAFNESLLRTPRVCDARYRELDRRTRPTTDCVERETAPWLSTWGIFSDRDPGSGNIEYDTAGGGFALGSNLRVHEHLGIAGAIGAGRSSVDVRSQGDGSLTTVSVGGRAVTELGPVALHAAASYQHGWHDVRRQMNIPGIARTADGEYQSDQVNAALEVLLPLEWQSFHFTPHVGVDVGWVHEESFDEDGADSLRLSVDSRDTTQVSGTAGLRIHTLLEPDSSWDDVYSLSRAVFVPELRAGYRRVFTDVDRDLDASFVGAPAGTGGFEAEGDDTPYLIELGAGISMQPRGGMTMGLHYDVGLGDDTVIHRAMLQLRVPLSVTLASD